MQCFHGTSAFVLCTDILAQLTCFSGFSCSFKKPDLKNVTHVDTCTVDFLSVCGHGFPFSIFLFRHVELQPCHTMCISLQGTTAVRRQKHHRLEHRLPCFRRCDPKVRSDLLVNDCCFFVGDRIPMFWSGFLNFIQLDFSFVIELNLTLD